MNKTTKVLIGFVVFVTLFMGLWGILIRVMREPVPNMFFVDDSTGPWRDGVVTIRRTMTLTCTLGQLHDWMLMDQPTTAMQVLFQQLPDEE